MNFTFDEAIALFAARQFLEPLAGTPFWRAASNAFAKIRSSLSNSVIKYLDRMSQKLHQTTNGAGDYAQKEQLIDQLMVGIEDSRAVSITYQSLRATEPVTYDVFPYGIAIHFGSLYLIGYHTEAGEVRTWKVDRINDAEASDVQFESPHDFDLAQHFANSFGVYSGSDDVLVRIRFTSIVARYVRESRWHISQRLRPQKDGSLNRRVSVVQHRRNHALDFEFRSQRRRIGAAGVDGADARGIEVAILRV